MKQLLLISTLLGGTFLSDAKENAYMPNSGFAVPTEFTLVEKRGNIALYERWFLYDSLTEAREVKVIFSVKTDLRSAINLLRDEANSSKWNLGTSQFRVVQENDHRWINYIRYDLPWPVSDHDCVLYFNLQQISFSTCVVSFEAGSHHQFPQTENAARLAGIRGKWLLMQQLDFTYIEYSITTMPSRSFPRWITDPIIRNNLLDSMVKFCRLLER